jgi:large subunit ribosomal protein L19
MQKKVLKFNQSQRTGEIDLRAGDVVKVYRKIKEGDKERIQIFEGMIIAVKGKQSSSPTITVRKVSNGVGIEIIVPVFSPTIEKVEIVKRAKVRRSKLYYVRERAAKALRFKFTDMGDRNAIIEEVKEKEVEDIENNNKKDKKQAEENKADKKIEKSENEEEIVKSEVSEKNDDEK